MAKEELVIQAPNFQQVTFTIIGTAPLVGNKFSEKAKQGLKEKQLAGSTAKGKKKREPKDFDEMYEGYRHISSENWDGIPATAIKASMVAACRTTGFEMTRAKQAFFVEADGFDRDDKQPLIKILKGEPKPLESYVKIQNTTDIVKRPMWEPGWEARVIIKFDADMLTKQDIANLLYRAGTQCGILAGRPSSRTSVGQGWGTFKLGGEN